MIQLNSTLLNQEQRSRLRRWLNQPEASIFITQIQNLSAVAQLETAKALVESEDELMARKHASDCRFFERVISEFQKMSSTSADDENQFEFTKLDLYITTPTTPTP